MSPLDKEDNPDLEIYQSLIGSLQWCVSLGRLDVAKAVMTLSSFPVAPRIGHLARAKPIIYFWDAVPYHYVHIRREYFFATGQDLPPNNEAEVVQPECVGKY